MGKLKAPVSERTAAKLSNREGMHAVGGTNGLYLCVRDGGRSWIFRYSLNDRRRDLGLGSYSDMTLLEAREAAREQRQLVRQGIDPVDAKRAGRDARRAASMKRMTFRQCVDGYLDAHGDGWRNRKHRDQWKNSLETYAGPDIGDLDVAIIDTPLVLRVLEPIWKTKTETATRLRGRIENVLSWATVRGFRHGDNPARWRGHLDQLLPKASKVTRVQHFAALPYRETGAFMQALRKQQGVAARAVEFAILTAARSCEVRGASWDEIDLQQRIWKIPADRMKAQREHIVPLSDAAVAVIKTMKKSKINDYIFPGQKDDKPLSDMSLTAVLRRMERGDLTVHGFRSTFRDWCAEQTAYPAEMAELALAHTINNKVEAAYRRGNMLLKRFKMMSDWARYCAQPKPKGEVVPFKKKAKA